MRKLDIAARAVTGSTCVALAVLAATPRETNGDSAAPAPEKQPVASGMTLPAASSVPVLAHVAGLNLPPALVTLHARQTPLKQVLASISSQTGVNLRFGPQTWHANTITLDVTRRPFWDVIRHLAKQTAISLEELPGDRGYTVRTDTEPANWPRGPSLQSGPFLIVADRLQRYETVDLSDASDKSPQDNDAGLRLTLAVLADPRIRIVANVPDMVEVQDAVDDRGTSLLSSGRTSFGLGLMGAADVKTTMLMGDVEIKNPSLMSQRFSLRGMLRLYALLKTDIWEISPVLQIRDQQRTSHILGETVRYTVNEVKKHGSDYTVRITAVREHTTRTARPKVSHGKRPMQPVQVWIGPRPRRPDLFRRDLLGAIKLIDGNGHAFLFKGSEGTGEEDQQENVLTFMTPPGAKLSEPAKLTWQLPVDVRQIDAPFAFKDLPLH